jgi:hypothetical protein
MGRFRVAVGTGRTFTAFVLPTRRLASVFDRPMPEIEATSMPSSSET